MYLLLAEMTKKSSINDQHIEDLDTALKTFPNFPLKELIVLSAIFSIENFSNLNIIFLIFIIFPFLILFSLKITTCILIEYENLKIVLKTIYSR